MDNATCKSCGQYNAMLFAYYADGVETLRCRNCGREVEVYSADPMVASAIADHAELARKAEDAYYDAEVESDREVERLAARAADYYYSAKAEPVHPIEEELMSQDEIYAEIADLRRAEMANERTLAGDTREDLSEAEEDEAVNSVCYSYDDMVQGRVPAILDDAVIRARAKRDRQFAAALKRRDRRDAIHNQ